MAHKICQLIQDKTRNCDIVRKLGVSLHTVKHIRRGNTWKEVSCNYTMTPSRASSISESTAIWVCLRILEGLKPKQIVKLSTNPNVTINVIKSIKRGNTHREVCQRILSESD